MQLFIDSSFFDGSPIVCFFYLGQCVSQPHFGLSVRMKLTLPKVGTLSPPGL
jgi:hypothetical protein